MEKKYKKYYLNRISMVRSAKMPSEKHFNRILEEANCVATNYDSKLDTQIYLCENKPEDSIMFGLKWEELDENSN